MSTLILDLDGTCLNYHTNEWLPGVVDRLALAAANGDKIVFITMRDEERDKHQIWNAHDTIELIEALPFKSVLILNASSPRVLIDDHQPQVMHTKTNSADWTKRFKG